MMLKERDAKMTKFHSTVSRREFMKRLGLISAGLGTAAAISPIRHDIDELISTPEGGRKLPWYIKEREFDNPSVEIDWTLQRGFDQRNYRQNASKMAEWGALTKKVSLEALRNNVPGNTLKDHAFVDAFHRSGLDGPWSVPERTFFVSQINRAADGIPAWQGSPEENFKMCASAVHYFGGREITALQISNNSRKIFCTNDATGKPYTFEDIDEPYSTDTKALAVPNKCQWVLVWSSPQSMITKVNHSVLAKASVFHAYSAAMDVRKRVQYFIRGLGYQAIGGDYAAKNVATNTGLGVLSGGAELGRVDYAVTPKFGALMRGSYYIVTDLPLSPTKPIDMGIWRFCQTCKLCAGACPGSALSVANEPTFDLTGNWNGPGRKCYHIDYSKCWRLIFDVGLSDAGPGGCNNCQTACVFSKMQEATIHELIKGTVAATPVFNTFFRNMDSAFGYGKGWVTPNGEIIENPEDVFWNRNLEDSPSGGTVIR
ncbi:reductive dehalogenase [Dehalogenimonas alkenigignens]|uniref:reductive dehalogenase n=1 Tax=Dehalogenimonas alkenigignens TaxID=1217799 RepID=UPI00140301A3|nr:reductive dehalogenase [Dehalogenimonas alkenigignens]